MIFCTTEYENLYLFLIFFYQIFYVAMLNRFKKFYLQIITFWILLMILITFLVIKPYDNISKNGFDKVYSFYFQTRNTTDVQENGTSSRNHLFNITDFTFLIHPDVDFCSTGDQNNEKIRAIFIITSHVSHVETRSVLRRTFPKEVLNRLKVKRVFLLGITQDDKYINQKAVEDEGRRFGDLVQGNFHEAYRNLTYKHVMGLKWVNQYCNTTQFVIKMDDDIIVNMMKVLDLLKKFNDKENFIGGYVLKGLQAKRERANKWFVTKEEYPMDIYPPFVSGWFYVTTPTLCKKIEQLSYAEKYFWIDDVFVTGILTQKIHVKMYDLKEYFTDHPEYFQCCMNDLTKYKFDCDILVGPNGGRTDLFYEFNKAFSICTQGNCLERPSPVSKSCYYNSKSLNLGKGSGVISTYKLI